jgi:hypothetical protein
MYGHFLALIEAGIILMIFNNGKET